MASSYGLISLDKAGWGSGANFSTLAVLYNTKLLALVEAYG
jgi:hypothetical protein